LKHDHFFGFNLLRKIGAKINIEKGVLEYKWKTKSDCEIQEKKYEISLIEINNTFPFKEFIITNIWMRKVAKHKFDICGK